MSFLYCLFNLIPLSQLGMWQVVLSIFRFGQLSWLFSDVAMSGYTSGAGIHLFTSQLKSLLGVKMPRRIGPLVVLRVSSKFMTKHNET